MQFSGKQLSSVGFVQSVWSVLLSSWNSEAVVCRLRVFSKPTLFRILNHPPRRLTRVREERRLVANGYCSEVVLWSGSILGCQVTKSPVQ